MNYKDIENNKPKIKIRQTEKLIIVYLTFYEDEQNENTWGTSSIRYEIVYIYETGTMQIWEIGAFGDATLVSQYRDRRGRGITESEMLENIEEFKNMTFKNFKAIFHKEEK